MKTKTVKALCCDTGAGDEDAVVEPAQGVEVPPRADQVAVLVLFGTEYGFAREIADKLAAQLREADRFWWVPS